jgi:dipeptidyl aminopeptidase/acylaminoacyl peptidase
MKRTLVLASLAAFLVLAIALPAHTQERATRLLAIDDLFTLRDVGDPRISPDGAWVAYTVRGLDAKEDTSDTDVWMVPFAGGEPLRLTSSKKGESSPRWSPDNRYLAFLSSREGKTAQVWLLPRQGGEAMKLTDFKGGVSSLEWSPDGKRLALVVSDPDPEEAAASEGGEKDKPKTPKPIVLNRLQFKRDGQGYLRDLRRHVHVFDVAAKTSAQVTTGPYDDSDPVWSPDGQWIAFVSNRTPEPDANDNSDIFVVPARSGETPRALTTSPGADSQPAFSPDGKTIAYVAGGDPKDMWYATNHVAVVPVAGGASKPLTLALDRNAGQPAFAPDGRFVYFLLEDGGNEHLARVPAAGGPVERVVAGEREVGRFDLGAKGEIVVLESQPSYPPEVFAVATPGRELRRLTRVNDDVLAGIRLGKVERLRAKSPDGTPVDGFLTRPPDAKPGEKLPTLLRIHGGPVAQFSNRFSFEWQIFAARGYAVVAGNPRGSSGYGRDFSRAIWAEWGVKDSQDVLALVDAAVAMGVADPDRLGLGGWSYGGILTNYVIVRTSRFKAATSGASISNILSGYGTDHYQHEYEVELGLPWQTTDTWLRISDPFLHADRIATPTLFLCGQDDMNVPLLNSEQMYQALRRLGVETQLVIYPGQNHGIVKPSYQKDRYERYLAWYDRLVKGDKPAPAPEKRPEATSLLGQPLFRMETPAEQGKKLEADLEKATADFVKDPDGADTIIWLGRRLAYLSRYREAVDVFSRGIARHPEDVRLLRHRGHRYITLRELDKAIADLEKADALIREKNAPDQVEPDGTPGPTPPTATTRFNVYYHLGLAHYLKGDFEKALAAYRTCMEYSKAPDNLVATTDWMYMTLGRLGRVEEAKKLLAPIRADTAAGENVSYLNRLLLYKGEKKVEEVLDPATDDALTLATQGYGVGNWYLYNGQPDKAKAVFERIVRGAYWPAFGFIAAEAELARMK